MQYRIGSLVVDASALAVRIGDTGIPLGPKVVATLVVLCERPGEVVTKEELIERVWPGAAVDETSLWQNVHLLRRTLTEHLADRGIENVRGRGYRLTLRVRRMPDAAAAPSSPAQRMGPAIVGACLAALALALALVPNVRTVLAPAPTAAARSPGSAPSATLRLARYYLARRTVAGAERAAGLFEVAAAAAPHDARGPAGLAEAEMMLSLMYGVERSPSGRALARRARRAAAQAASIDAASPAALTAQAMVRENLGDGFGTVDARYRVALERDPDYAPARLRYGISLLVRGRVGPALEELRRAAELDPSSAVTQLWLANALYVARRPAEAVAAARNAMTLDTQTDDARILLGLALLNARRLADARTIFASFRTEAPLETRALLAAVAATGGDVVTARRDLGPLARESRTDPDASVDVAFAEIAAGELAAAHAALERVPPLPRLDRSLLALDPRFDSVRGDHRFDRWTRL